MVALWDEWWAWMAGAFVLALLEMVLPGHVLLGFAVGAGLVGLGLLLLGPAAVAGLGGPAALLLLFAVLSAAAWVVLRRLFRSSGGSAKTFEDDVNED